MAVFRQALAAVLSRSAPPGEFNVREPKALSEAVITPEDFEGEAVRVSRVSFLISSSLVGRVASIGADRSPPLFGQTRFGFCLVLKSRFGSTHGRGNS